MIIIIMTKVTRFFSQWRSPKNPSDRKFIPGFLSSSVSNMYDLFQNFSTPW